MIEVYNDFYTRKQEINRYYDFIQLLIEQEAVLILKDKTVCTIEIELFPSLRANLILKLYNIMEAIVRQSIDAIHLHITFHTNTVYTDCIQEIQQIWIEFEHKNFQHSEWGSKEIWARIERLNQECIHIADADDEKQSYLGKVKGIDISGAIDRRKITDLGKKYGFNTQKITAGNESFRIKKERNDLAHGRITFQECGNKYQLSDLSAMKEDIFLFLLQIMNVIEIYLRYSCYKKRNPPSFFTGMPVKIQNISELKFTHRN